MKHTIVAVSGIVIALVLLWACADPVGMQFGDSVPDDSVSKIARQDRGEFGFETVLPVTFEVSAHAVDTAEGPAASASKKPVVSLYAPDGALTRRVSVPSAGTVEFEVMIPANPRDYTVEVEVPGVSKKSFDLADLVQAERVIIDAYMTPNSLATQSEADLADDDGDGVPNIYDAYPDDPELAFDASFPFDGWLTVAFEDNFPNVGDADYNDFVVQYRATVTSDAENRITAISGRVRARARAAGYDHRFGIVINFPDLSGNLTAWYNDPETPADRTFTALNDSVTDSADITVFPNTKQAFRRPTDSVSPDNGYPDRTDSVGFEARFSLSNLAPTIEDVVPDVWHVDLPPFDPYLYVHNTTFDVHMIGKPELDPTNNPPQTFDWDFRDQAGYPRALLVPTDWGHPIETNHIENAYPDFAQWRDSEGADAVDWYLNPDPDQVVYPPSP